MLAENIGMYVGRQLFLTENFKEADFLEQGKEKKEEDNHVKWKSFIREGVPDKHKRRVILKLFDIRSE